MQRIPVLLRIGEPVISTIQKWFSSLDERRDYQDSFSCSAIRNSTAGINADWLLPMDHDRYASHEFITFFVTSPSLPGEWTNHGEATKCLTRAKYWSVLTRYSPTRMHVKKHVLYACHLTLSIANMEYICRDNVIQYWDISEWARDSDWFFFFFFLVRIRFQILNKAIYIISDLLIFTPAKISLLKDTSVLTE